MRRAAILLCFAVGASANPFSTIYFFGDSLSDTGNILTLSTIANQVSFGLVPVQPVAPYFQGRFSNGPVWVETVARNLGMAGTAAPGGFYLGPLGGVTGPGNNYAIGGARTDFGGALGPLDGVFPTGMLMQTLYHLYDVNNTIDPNALYVLAGGSNDLRDAALQPTLAGRRAAAELAADYLVYSAFVLYSSGARNFYVSNAPNVGNTPEALRVRNNSAAAAQATGFYNARLDLYRQFFSLALGIDWIYGDLFSFYNNLYADTLAGGSQFGFTNATLPCFAGFAGSTGANCAVSLFADDLHPTAAVHALYGAYATNLIQSSALRQLSRLSSTSFQSLGEFRAGFASHQTPEPGTFVMAGFALAILWRARRG
jgi:outer membrane lipase/esterase